MHRRMLQHGPHRSPCAGDCNVGGGLGVRAEPDYLQPPLCGRNVRPRLSRKPRRLACGTVARSVAAVIAARSVAVARRLPLPLQLLLLPCTAKYRSPATTRHTGAANTRSPSQQLECARPLRYDARLDQRGWDAPNFAPSVPWVAATVRTPVVQQVLDTAHQCCKCRAPHCDTA